MTLRIDAEALISRSRVSPETMAILLCHLVKQQLRATKKGQYPHFRLVSYTRAFRKQTRVLLLPTGAALTRLKTQYAKKPKNPV